MRSDWYDAPEHLRSRKKQGPLRLLLILGIGSAVIWALALTFGKPIVLDMNQIKQGVHIGGVPWFNKEQAQPMQTVSQPPVASYG
ncbi:MAG TPA: hypothetical protein DD835_05120, partial [Halomonas sp.]|nr:hypothetical protein [Halomonas sp.]